MSRSATWWSTRSSRSARPSSSGWARSSRSVTADEETEAVMLKTPDWGMMIVLYFFFGGIAGGAYFTAAVADNVGGPRSSRVALVGYRLARPLVGFCRLLLTADFGL